MRKHRCCPCQLQTWLALLTLYLVLILMAVMQIYSDKLPDYPPECSRLRDFAFRLLPDLRHLGVTPKLADIWVVVSIGTFLIAIFVLQRPQLVVRRFCWIMTYIWLMRAFLLPSTRYPGLPDYTARYTPDNWFAGALLIIAGVHQTSTDLLFSGHTAHWVITACLLNRYSKYHPAAVFYWLFNIGGILALLSLHEHYLTDVLAGIYISLLVFWAYHLFFDSFYRQYWDPRVEVKLPEPDYYYKEWHDRSLAWYTRLYYFLKWLDSE